MNIIIDDLPNALKSVSPDQSPDECSQSLFGVTGITLLNIIIDNLEEQIRKAQAILGDYYQGPTDLKLERNQVMRLIIKDEYIMLSDGDYIFQSNMVRRWQEDIPTSLKNTIIYGLQQSLYLVLERLLASSLSADEKCKQSMRHLAMLLMAGVEAIYSAYFYSRKQAKYLLLHLLEKRSIDYGMTKELLIDRSVEFLDWSKLNQEDFKVSEVYSPSRFFVELIQGYIERSLEQACINYQYDSLFTEEIQAFTEDMKSYLAGMRTITEHTILGYWITEKVTIDGPGRFFMLSLDQDELINNIEKYNLTQNDRYGILDCLYKIRIATEYIDMAYFCYSHTERDLRRKRKA